MVKRFTTERLEALLKIKPVSQAGREFIFKALEKPSRNVQGTTMNVASDIPCPKMWGNAQTESWSVENPFTLEHIFNDAVIGYTNQVPRIELFYKGRNGKNIRSPYTGDCLRIDENLGVVVEEWKPSSDRQSLEEKYPGKYEKDEAGVYNSAAIRLVLDPMGIGFTVRFSDEVSSIAHRNRRYLYPYLQPSAESIYLPKFPKLIELFNDKTSATYSEIAEAGADIDVLNWAIANGRLHIDFDYSPLTTATHLVQVFRHVETMKTWKLATKPDGTLPNSAISVESFQLSPGDSFIFDGQRLTVTLTGATAVYAANSRNEHVAIDHSIFMAAIRSGKAVLPDRCFVEKSKGRLWRTSPANLQRAISRLEILERVNAGETISLTDRYSDSTYRRWRRLIRDGEAAGITSVESLLDEGEHRGFHGTHIAEDFSIRLNEWITEALKNQLAKSLRTIYYDIGNLAKEEGFRMIAKSSFYERVAKLKDIKTIQKSLGHKVAYPLLPTYWMLEQSTPVHCERAMELVHFDSTLLDVELRSSISGEILGRPWLSVAICANSRRVVGMYLSFKAPSYVSSMMLLTDIVKRTGRLPDSIIHDWGSEFKAKDFKYALTTLLIIRHIRPKSAPRFGSIIERMFGVVTSELISNIAGNTKLRKNVRQLSPQSDPSVHSGLWLADIYQGLEDYFFNIYDNRKHSTTLRPPRAMFDASFIVHGNRLHRVRRIDDLLTLLTPTAKGKLRTIDPARGVYVNYRYYGHPSLTKLVSENSCAIVKPLPFDPGTVLVFMKGEWLLCRSGLHADLQGASEVTRRCLYEEWLLEQSLVGASHDFSRKKLRELLDRMNAKALENKDYFRDRELRAVLATAAFPIPVATDISRESSSLDRLNSLMASALSIAIGSSGLGQLV